MHVFQILNKEITIIDGDKTYIDSFDNFVDDGGRHDLPEKVIYDATQKCCVVDDSFLPYPQQEYEDIIASLIPFKPQGTKGTQKLPPPLWTQKRPLERSIMPTQWIYPMPILSLA